MPRASAHCMPTISPGGATAWRTLSSTCSTAHLNARRLMCSTRLLASSERTYAPRTRGSVGAVRRRRSMSLRTSKAISMAEGPSDPRSDRRGYRACAVAKMRLPPSGIGTRDHDKNRSRPPFATVPSILRLSRIELSSRSSSQLVDSETAVCHEWHRERAARASSPLRKLAIRQTTDPGIAQPHRTWPACSQFADGPRQRDGGTCPGRGLHVSDASALPSQTWRKSLSKASRRMPTWLSRAGSSREASIPSSP
mmetsp:Transcript_2735/g.7575  ORF Transcript_2735/g.7575 Transcript_2735/m.7575 type:complete len:253 (-) Transcript_2735:1534-2292(-)